MNRKIMFATFVLSVACAALAAEPSRVLVLDFDDQTGLAPSAELGGGISPGALAQKGAALLARDLLGSGSFTLIDRRDFLAQLEKQKLTDAGEPTTAKPTFIHAAQTLNADVVLRGGLLSFSSSKQAIDQGGYKSEEVKLTLRVMLEALDPVGGSVVAMSDGSSTYALRQTANVVTTLGEDEAVQMLEKAIAAARPKVETALQQYEQKLAGRTKVSVGIKTSEDPALIEVDGVVIGSSPLQNHAIYAGDHVLTILKPGYYRVTKRILFEKDTQIEVPMLRIKLSADEIKGILDKANLDIVSGIEPALLIKTLD